MRIYGKKSEESAEQGSIGLAFNLVSRGTVAANIGERGV